MAITAIGIGLFIGLLAKSPILVWLCKIAALFLWAAVTLGSALFVAFGIHLPHGRVGMAIIVLIIGAVAYIPWFAFGWPLLRQSFPPKKENLSIWS